MLPALRRAIVACSVVVAAALMPACGPKVYDDPIAVMDAASVDLDKRVDAAQQAERQSATDPRRIAALNNILWGRNFSRQEQVYAARQLMQYDEANFRLNIRKRINLIGSYEVLDPIYQEAVARKWTDLTPTIVRCYARPVHAMAEKDRPEARVLEQLNPGKSTEEVIFDVFADAKDAATPEERTAAWALLNRITPRERVHALLAKAPNTTPLVIDLRTCLNDLKTFPRDKEGVIWLMYLRDSKRSAWWANAKAAVAKLNAEQLTGLELRHLPAIMQLDSATLAANRQTLLRDLDAAITGAEHFFNSPTYDGQSRDYPQTLRETSDKLTWADLAVIRVLLRAVREPSVAASLLAQADADFKDKTSEHGGAMIFNTNFEARAYDPQIRRHDLKFIPSQTMFEAIYTGLAHYHFHAQEISNTDFAGPGAGDLEFADTHHMNCLVFTNVGKGRLNVDYYQSGGVVIDLGTIGAK